MTSPVRDPYVSRMIEQRCVGADKVSAVLVLRPWLVFRLVPEVFGVCIRLLLGLILVVLLRLLLLEILLVNGLLLVLLGVMRVLVLSVVVTHLAHF